MTTRALQFDMLLAGLTDDDGNPLAGGTVTFYAGGTSTLKNVYTDKAKTAPYTELTLDSGGRTHCYGDGLYKVVIKDSSGTTYDTFDNVFIRAANFYARTVTGNTTATVEDDFIMCNTNGGTITVTLMEIADGGVSHPLNIKRNGSNTVVIDGGASETIDGAATYTISVDKRTVQLISDGTNWQISSIPVASMWDADEDTGIQVEEGADEDIIRFDTGGTERFIVSGNAIIPTTADTLDLGSTTKELNDIYLGDAGKVYLGSNQDGYISHTGSHFVIQNSTGQIYIYSTMRPGADDSIDLGTSSAQWKNLYVDGKAYLDAIDFNGTDITATGAELNILSGVTADKDEINLLDGLSTFFYGKYERGLFTYNGGATAYTVKVKPGNYFCKDKYCQWASELTTTAIDAPGADDWYYLYLDYSAITSATAITNSELIWSNTEPSYNTTYRQWMNGDDRCIFAALTNSGPSNIVEFVHESNKVYYVDQIEDRSMYDYDLEDGWVDLVITMPKFSTGAIVTFSIYSPSGELNRTYWRTNGVTGTDGHKVLYTRSGGAKDHITGTSVVTDGSQTIEIKHSNNNDAGTAMHTDGWYFPQGI